MTSYRMYTEFARLWPQVSAPEQYAEEAHEWLDTLFGLLDMEPGRDRPRVLEMGVGGGNSLSHLAPFVDAVATDIAPAMLDISQELNPGVRHIEGDMRSLRLGEKFDAVLAHDAISYMVTENDLRETFSTARAHLEPGGVFIAGPDWMRGVTPLPDLTCKLGAPGELSYAEFAHDPDPADTEIEVIFTFYLPQEDGSVRVEEDRHRHGLFPLATWLRLLREAGFEAGTRQHSLQDTIGPGFLVTGVAL